MYLADDNVQVNMAVSHRASQEFCGELFTSLVDPTINIASYFTQRICDPSLSCSVNRL